MRRAPQKSLRTLLMLWFLVFSLVPLTFITGYSLRTYETAINNEVKQRLRGNARELTVIINDYEKYLVTNSLAHVADPSLPYHLSTNNFQGARKLIFHWMNGRSADRISLFNRGGCFLASVFRGENGEPQSVPNVESGTICAQESFLKKVATKNRVLLVEFSNQKNLDLVYFTVVRDRKGQLAGYLEQVIVLTQSSLINLKKRMNLELGLIDPNGRLVAASHADVTLAPADLFKDIKAGERFKEVSIRETPYSLFIKPIQWGEQKFSVVLGASKSESNSVLHSISVALLFVGLAVIVFLIVLSLISSRLILKPLSTLVEATQSMEGDKALQIPVSADNEIGLLTASFNEMSARVAQARSDLQGKVTELEKAYADLKETQARLVHTAKMASLGQLVAGVAHELNNPIGFIYSNMDHLRDYSERLLKLLKAAESHPQDLPQLKTELEFDYIVEDLPRLIKSCEDGAKRTRDIVMGLRNFSRLEEAKAKKVDIREGIEATLKLLAGDLKNRITVKKNFKEVPSVMCYPSQLNQVFMNILANAAQAIEGEGEIRIEVEPAKIKKQTFVRVTIADSGRGMTSEVLEKIFDPFFTTKSVGQGTGLGLSISYGIVKNHHGDIQVTSKPGKGTEFVITLPVDGIEKNT